MRFDLILIWTATRKLFYEPQQSEKKIITLGRKFHISHYSFSPSVPFNFLPQNFTSRNFDLTFFTLFFHRSPTFCLLVKIAKEFLNRVEKNISQLSRRLLSISVF
jgi:hypothetical protein